MTVPVKLKHEDLEQLKGSIVIIKKKVYDVRDFVVHHPGGPVIKTYLTGENATGTLPSHFIVGLNYEFTMHRCVRYIPSILCVRGFSKLLHWRFG